MNKNYDESSSRSIEEYARKLMGTSLLEELGEARVDNEISTKGKGKLGNLVEEKYFGYKVNSRKEADFKKAEVELKVSPLKKIIVKEKSKLLREREGLSSKERIVLTIINFLQVGEENWGNNSLFKKCKELLLMFYIHENDKKAEELVFRIISLWKPSEEDMKVIENDWKIINEKIKNGKAHEISEGDTMYLGACTKGSTAEKSKRKQPFSERLAPQRAFCYKSSYVNFIIEELMQKEIYRQKSKKTIAKSIKTDVSKTFDKVVLERLNGLENMSVIDIKNLFNIERERKAKHYIRLITEDICKVLFGDKLNKLDQFKKAEIEMKVIVTQPDGMPKESMSFEQIDYCDIVTQKWDNSEMKSKFENKKFLWVIYKAKRPYSKQEDLNLNEIIFDRAMFWNMPICDLEDSLAYVWNDTVEKIRMGNYDNFIQISDDRKVHIRYKGKNSKDKAPTIQGHLERKRCFWLNNDYVKSQIELKR